MEGLNLQQVQENLDIAYITSKLRQSCFLLSHQNIYRKEYDFGMLPQMLTYIEQQSLLDIPAISVYYYCYHALVSPKEYNYFEKFKELMFQHQSLFPKLKSGICFVGYQLLYSVDESGGKTVCRRRFKYL